MTELRFPLSEHGPFVRMPEDLAVQIARELFNEGAHYRVEPNNDQTYTITVIERGE